MPHFWKTMGPFVPAFARCQSMGEAFNATASAARAVFDTDCCLVAVSGDQVGEPHLWHLGWTSLVLSELQRWLHAPHGPVGTTLEPVFEVEGVAVNGGPLLPALWHDRSLRRLAVLPLTVDDSSSGLLILGWQAASPMDEQRRAAMLAFSGICSLGLASGKLHAEARHDREMSSEAFAQASALNAGSEVKSTARLAAAVEELEAFSYSVSHDLRAPLRAIDGFSRLLVEEHSEELSATSLRYLQRIRHNASNMGTLIDDLLAFSRLNREALNKTECSVEEIARECVQDLHPEMSGRDVEVTIEQMPACSADRRLLKQVVFNLLANAVKFSRDTAVARILCSGVREGAECIYRITDNGAGFDMRYRDKLFGVFQRLHRADEFEGTGVGLALAQRIVRRHDGRIWAESAPGKGASFWFALPIRE